MVNNYFASWLEIENLQKHNIPSKFGLHAPFFIAKGLFQLEVNVASILYNEKVKCFFNE